MINESALFAAISQRYAAQQQPTITFEEFFAQESKKLEEIRAGYDDNTTQRLLEDDRHKRAIEQLTTQLRAIQKRCPHYLTNYHPDASGNNDSEEECLLCGKWAHRL